VISKLLDSVKPVTATARVTTISNSVPTKLAEKEKTEAEANANEIA
jgi:hypothetical protein